MTLGWTQVDKFRISSTNPELRINAGEALPVIESLN